MAASCSRTNCSAVMAGYFFSLPWIMADLLPCTHTGASAGCARHEVHGGSTEMRASRLAGWCLPRLQSAYSAGSFQRWAAHLVEVGHAVPRAPVLARLGHPAGSPGRERSAPPCLQGQQLSRCCQPQWAQQASGEAAAPPDAVVVGLEGVVAPAHEGVTNVDCAGVWQRGALRPRVTLCELCAGLPARTHCLSVCPRGPPPARQVGARQRFSAERQTELGAVPLPRWLQWVTAPAGADFQAGAVCEQERDGLKVAVAACAGEALWELLALHCAAGMLCQS